MENYVFRIRLHDPLDDDDAGRLYDAFDEEISCESGPKGHWISFDRQSPAFLDAVLDALAEVIDLGFEPLAVEDELVSISDIAARTQRTRQSISLLVEGHRGSGDFPPPVAGNVRSPLWHWADVAAWFETKIGGRSTGDRMRTIAAVNGELSNRVLAREKPGDLKRIREAIAR